MTSTSSGWRSLESIANSFHGVEKSFAIQAGREVRIIVKPEEVDEIGASQLARDVARKIEESMDYPGQIKVSCRPRDALGGLRQVSTSGHEPAHIDLHTHSTASDGLFSPTELVRRASEAGLTLIGLIDHDTTNGVAEAQAAGANMGVTVIPGIEINTTSQRARARRMCSATTSM